MVQKQERKLHVVEFVHGNNPNQIIWAAWSPTGDGQVQKHRLNGLPGILHKVDAMALTEEGGERAEGKVLGPDTLSLTVSESPVYLHFKVRD